MTNHPHSPLIRVCVCRCFWSTGISSVCRRGSWGRVGGARSVSYTCTQFGQ